MSRAMNSPDTYHYHVPTEQCRHGWRWECQLLVSQRALLSTNQDIYEVYEKFQQSEGDCIILSSEDED